ncbi:Uncharacterised protein [Brucella neotomae]|nr:Uncharacterised protein [Brucella neotomae]
MEGGIFGGQAGNGVLGKAKLHVAGCFIQHDTGGKLGQNLVLDADCLGLFAGEPLAELLRKAHKLLFVGKAIIGRADLGITGCQRGVACHAATEDIRDAPDRKA